MTKIQSRVINRGNPCESEWPPMEPAGEPGIYHWNHDTRTFEEGPPPCKIQKFGEAPYVIQDSLNEPYFHPAAEQWVDSRRTLRDCDKVTGTITTDKLIPADPWQQNQNRKARHQDMKESLRRAVHMVDNNEALMSEETRHKCQVQNEIVSKALNMDAFNVAGRKSDARGKKFREPGKL